MPLQYLTTMPDPGHMVHVCASCGATHTISFDRAGTKTKTGPFTLAVGDALVVRVDDAPPSQVVFAAGDFADVTHVTAEQLAARLATGLPAARARDDAGGVLLESATTGPASRIEIVDGTARSALGFSIDGPADPCTTRPALGVSLGGGAHRDPDVFALRRCNDCGANECLVRTFDETPPHLVTSHFHAHRCAVNALAEHARARGWSHPDLVAHHAAERRRPTNLAVGFAERPITLPPYKMAAQPAVRPTAAAGGVS